MSEAELNELVLGWHIENELCWKAKLPREAELNERALGRRIENEMWKPEFLTSSEGHKGGARRA